MKLKREFFGYRLRRRRFYALRRKFLDALAPRRATKGAEKPASWLDDSFGCWLPIWYCPFTTSTSVASLLLRCFSTKARF